MWIVKQKIENKRIFLKSSQLYRGMSFSQNQESLKGLELKM